MAHVVICVPSYDKQEPAFAKSLREVKSQHTITVLERWHMPIEKARNELVEAFLALRSCAYPTVEPPTHLLFVDDDMVFEPDDIDVLVGLNKDIVGALCFVRDPPYQPTMLKRNDPRCKLSNEYGYIYEYEEDRLYEVDATGCGFLLIKRDVLLDTAEHKTVHPGKWFDRFWNLAEDYSFCWKARSAGYKIHVYTGIQVGHVSKVVVDGDFARRNRFFQIDPWIDFEKMK